MKLALFFGFFAVAVYADVRLPHMLGSHMVLQRERPIHAWGWADPGEAVAVTFDGQTQAATTNALGRWSVWLAPHAAGGPYTVTIKGHNTVTLDDVLLGDVWVASGQSNMEMPLKGFPDAPIKNGAAAIQAANQPQLRLLLVKRATSNYPQADLEGSWQPCNPETAADFSAAAYFFGREIAARENVPIGLIDSTWGGTPADAWTSLEGFASNANLTPAFSAWATMANEEQDRAMRVAQDKNHWHPDPASWAPAALYNAMIAPLTPAGIKGVIWYQGESNSGSDRVSLYQQLFQTMITDWRQRFAQGDFPFLFVQISSFETKDQWPKLREAQRRALQLVNTGMAVTIDVGEPHNIHPADKETVGSRLALAARAIAYGEKLEFSGPAFRQVSEEGSSLRAWFDHADGLQSKGEGLSGFEIAGEDRHFMPATAHIDGSSVVAASPGVAQPRYLRYAWKSVPSVPLFNGAGLPASPFTSEP